MYIYTLNDGTEKIYATRNAAIKNARKDAIAQDSIIDVFTELQFSKGRERASYTTDVPHVATLTCKCGRWYKIKNFETHTCICGQCHNNNLPII